MQSSHSPARGNRSFSRRRHARPFSSAPHRRHGGNARSHSPQSRGKSARVLKTFDPSQFINKTPAAIAEVAYTPKHDFTQFGFVKQLERAVIGSGMSVPTPIQDQSIPVILEGRDIIGLAETGTGKTAAFLLPLIHKTIGDPSRQTLILAPTRELAIQIHDELRKFTKQMKIYATVCVGGTSLRPQISALRRKNHFIIGTPGRVLDLIERGSIAPERMTTVVLDEADRMLDMGFIHDMRRILSEVPEDHETLFFSATMSDEIKNLVNDFLRDPAVISVKKRDVTSSIEQDVVPYTHNSKFDTLALLLSKSEFNRVLVFGAMKHSVEKLSKQLCAAGIPADSIHGNKSHGQRQNSLKRFKTGAVRVLVATDVAARGIHVEDVSHVINYDLPSTFEDYVHRIGRTGRGSKTGKALTFVEAH
jgi:superfamily II DNA/RNA helicase